MLNLTKNIPMNVIEFIKSNILSTSIVLYIFYITPLLIIFVLNVLVEI